MTVELLTFSSDAPPPPIASTEPIMALVTNVSRVGCWSLAFQPPVSQSVTLVCNFSESGAIEINLREMVATAKIDAIRSLYIYNDNDYDITILNQPSGFKNKIRAQSCGYVPLFALHDEFIYLYADKEIGTVHVMGLNVVMPLSCIDL